MEERKGEELGYVKDEQNGNRCITGGVSWMVMTVKTA